MNPILRLCGCTALALVVTSADGHTALRPGSRQPLLVTPAWLASHLADPDLVLLHVGDRTDYDARHIPGARFVSTRDISVVGPGPLTLEMPDAADLRTRLETLGISDASRVVVYAEADGISPATRVVFTLMHAGLERVALLDGGMKAWTAAGQIVTAAVPPARMGSLSTPEMRNEIVDADFVRSRAGTPGYAVIDARAREFYVGATPGGPRDKRMAGHIPGALSIPFSDVTAEDLRLKPKHELEQVFAAAGVKPGDTVIAYCHIGQQATAVVFAARLLGYAVRLYDGSFEDWVRRGLPVTDPASR